MTLLDLIDFHMDVKHMVILTYFFRGKLLSPHVLLFLIGSKGSVICTFPHTGQHILHIAFDGPVVGDWLEQKIAQTTNAPAMQD